MRVREPGVIPFNDETVTDPTHEKVISFVSFGVQFRLSLSVPLYIWNALSAEDWDFAEKQIRERAEKFHLDNARAGHIGDHRQFQNNLQEFAKTAVYNQFMKYQLAAGNTEGHAAPQGW